MADDALSALGSRTPLRTDGTSTRLPTCSGRARGRASFFALAPKVMELSVHACWLVRLDQVKPMKETVNIYEAKTRLSQLVDRAAKGDDVIIARAGRPVARLIAFRPTATVRKPGRMRGRIRVGKDFDAPLPDDLFESSKE